MGSGSSIPEAVGHVVIVGAGYAGTELALAMKKGGGKYTLIDGQDSFHHCIASSRALVKEEYSQNMFIPLKEVFGDNFRQGQVVSIDPEGKKVTLADDKEVNYDTLVIATGTQINFPGKIHFSQKDEAVEKYKDFMDRVKASKRIVLVGGGPVGVEIAGEIATELKEKEVTLIHGAEKLCHPDTTNKFQTIVQKYLAEIGVKVILGEKVTNLEDLAQDGEVTAVTDKDTHVTADMAIICIGSMRARSGAFESSLASSIDDRGALKVNEYLQVEGHDDIFAIGDCNNVKELKVAYLAQEQGNYVADYLKKKARNKALKPYRLHNSPVFLGVTIGRNHGVLQMKNGMIAPEFLMKKLKCKDMLLKSFYNRMGMKLPTAEQSKKEHA